MTEGLEELERRVAAVIERYRDTRQLIEQLESRLKEAARQRQQLEVENSRLRQRLGVLESELASHMSREDVAKNKLQHILGQIDSLEAEIAAIEASGDEPRQES
ncbi:hypothetical protein FJY63_03700 [Candidatus Sumerlaeota bacterium]|nr:hypothetical protein [Candidatus Sumerlaeota bacterium]